MKYKIVIAALMVVLASPAFAQFTPITKGYEVALSDFRSTRVVGGSIAYKPCATCNYVQDMVRENTRWIVNKKSVSLEEFNRRIDAVADRDNHTVTVQRHLASNQIVRVSIYIR